jgi:hypothetical protein
MDTPLFAFADPPPMWKKCNKLTKGILKVTAEKKEKDMASTDTQRAVSQDGGATVV